MRIVTVANTKFGLLSEAFCEEDESGPDARADVLLCGFSAFGEVDLEEEIVGESDCMATAAKLSALYPAVVITGLKTRLSGLKHLSAAVAHRGRLLDIVDRTQDLRGDGYLPGNKIKIYRTEKIRAALLVDTDVLIAKNWSRVAELCDVVVAVALEVSDGEAALVSTLGSMFGLPYVLLAENGLWWSEGTFAS